MYFRLPFRRRNTSTREQVPLFAILEETLTMILGDEFGGLVFDSRELLSEEETDYVRGFAKPYAVAMLFSNLFTQLKKTQPDLTAERLKAYFTEIARDVYWLYATPDADAEADQLISIGLSFLDFNIVFDIDDSELEPDDEPSITKFVNAIFPEHRPDDPLQKKKIRVVVRFAEVIEETMKKLTKEIFGKADVTLLARSR